MHYSLVSLEFAIAHLWVFIFISEMFCHKLSAQARTDVIFLTSS